MAIYQTSDGKFIRARYDERALQFTSSDIRRNALHAIDRQSYAFSYARSLDGLAKVGIRTYRNATEAGAACAPRGSVCCRLGCDNPGRFLAADGSGDAVCKDHINDFGAAAR